MAPGPQSKAFLSSVRAHGIVEVFSLVGDEVQSPTFLPQHLQPAFHMLHFVAMASIPGTMSGWHEVEVYKGWILSCTCSRHHEL